MAEELTKARICRACGKDCAGQPRIKDAKGRYLHKACYEKARARALQKKREREAALVTDDALALDDGGVNSADMFGAVDSPQAGLRPCPQCGQPLPQSAMICTSCGHNFATGKALGTKSLKEKAAKEKKPKDYSWLASAPLICSVYAVVMVLIALGLAESPALAGVIVVAYLVALVSGLTLLVASFMDSVMHGVLTLFVPFYALIWLLLMCENRAVKWFCLVAPLTLFAVIIATGAFLAEEGATNPLFQETPTPSF